MRRVLLGLFIFLLIWNTVESQNDTIIKYYLSAGIGYFGDVIEFINPSYDFPNFVKINPDVKGKIYNGKTVWFKTGYKLNTGYILSGYYSMATTSYEMNDPTGLFWNEHVNDIYNILSIVFSKEFGKKNNRFSLGTGLLYRTYNHQDVYYQITPVYNQDNELIEVLMGMPEPYNLKMNDLGLVFNLEYSYRFNNRFMLGLSCSTNLIFDIGFETISVSPFIGCIF
jgi:hypothetical protein